MFTNAKLDTQVTSLGNGGDVTDSVLGGNVTVELDQLAAQNRTVPRAKPVHTPVYYVFDGRMPCRVDGSQVFVIDYISDGVRVLESSEVAQLRIG